MSTSHFSTPFNLGEIRRNTQANTPSKNTYGTTGLKRVLKASRFPRRIRFGCKPNLPALGVRRSLFLKLTPMVRLGMQIANVKQRQILPRMGKIWVSTPQNRTYRVWGNIELPKYFLKLHQTAPTGLRSEGLFLKLAYVRHNIGNTINAFNTTESFVPPFRTRYIQ